MNRPFPVLRAAVAAALIAAISPRADIVNLASGRQVTGIILSYDADGLVVRTEDGRITIPRASLASFSIERDDDEGAFRGVPYASSALYQDGLRLDTALFQGFALDFDVIDDGVEYAIRAQDESRGFTMLVTRDPAGLENAEYYSATLEAMKRNLDSYKDIGPRKDMTANGISFITREFGTRFDDLDLVFLSAFFVHGGANYRVMISTQKSSYKSEKARLQGLLKAFSVKPS